MIGEDYMAGMRCPKCGSTNFKSLRIIYEDGTKTYTRSHTSVKGNDSTTTSTTQTLLAQSVAPPVAPTEPMAPAKKFNLDFLIVILFFGYIYFLNSKVDFKDLSLMSFIMIIVVTFIPITISILIHKETLKNNEWNETEYPKVYEEWKNTVYADYQRSYEQWQYNYNQWQHSYLCKKCGNIFTD